MLSGRAGVVLAQELLEVEHQVWTESVDRSSGRFGRIYKSPVKLREIYLWTRLKGSRELLDQLRASSSGTVAISHLWMRYGSDRVQAEGDVQLNVGSKEDLDKLGHQVAAQGFFLWTVWSKHQLTPGYWRVDVLYADSYEPIMCKSPGGTEPCSYDIEVE